MKDLGLAVRGKGTWGHTVLPQMERCPVLGRRYEFEEARSTEPGGPLDSRCNCLGGFSTPPGATHPAAAASQRSRSFRLTELTVRSKIGFKCQDSSLTSRTFVGTPKQEPHEHSRNMIGIYLPGSAYSYYILGVPILAYFNFLCFKKRLSRELGERYPPRL